MCRTGSLPHFATVLEEVFHIVLQGTLRRASIINNHYDLFFFLSDSKVSLIVMYYLYSLVLVVSSLCRFVSSDLPHLLFCLASFFPCNTHSYKASAVICLISRCIPCSSHCGCSLSLVTSESSTMSLVNSRNARGKG